MVQVASTKSAARIKAVLIIDLAQHFVQWIFKRLLKLFRVQQTL
jgi:hypothetical protein